MTITNVCFLEIHYNLGNCGKEGLNSIAKFTLQKTLGQRHNVRRMSQICITNFGTLQTHLYW